MTPSRRFHPRHRQAFTLIELLVVIAIISLLISILMPSLSRARDQAKKIHCLARLKDIGNGLAAYENLGPGALPPALWRPEEDSLDRITYPAGTQGVEYGWAETIFAYLYAEEVRLPYDYPVMRNIDGRKWQKYFLCQSVADEGESSGHYRVYLPAWSAGTYTLEADGRYGDTTRANPLRGAQRDRIRPRLPLIGDANDASERGNGIGDDDCSYIDAGEANFAGSDTAGRGNRFSDRHYGGTNYLFQDLHATWSSRLRAELARDYDLNGVIDIESGP